MQLINHFAKGPNPFPALVLRVTRNCFVGACLTLVLLTGCSRSPLDRDVGRVSGIVTFEGKPLEGAQVLFQPSDFRPSVGVTDKSGRYELQLTQNIMGAVVGDHQVRITTEQFAQGGEGGAEAKPARAEFLPEKFHEKTELTASVKPGKNQFNFDLTK